MKQWLFLHRQENRKCQDDICQKRRAEYMRIAFGKYFGQWTFFPVEENFCWKSITTGNIYSCGQLLREWNYRLLLSGNSGILLWVSTICFCHEIVQAREALHENCVVDSIQCTSIEGVDCFKTWSCFVQFNCSKPIDKRNFVPVKDCNPCRPSTCSLWINASWCLHRNYHHMAEGLALGNDEDRPKLWTK